jgi:hypothetical protein
MKFIVSVVLMAILSVAACLYLPWWTIAPVAFLVAALIPQKPGKSFLTGFISLFLLWGSLTWYISSNNDHILAHKVSVLIIKENSAAMLVGITALIGALVAGFAALAGSYLRKS